MMVLDATYISDPATCTFVRKLLQLAVFLNRHIALLPAFRTCRACGGIDRIFLPPAVPDSGSACRPVCGRRRSHDLFDELLPMAETYGKHHIALAGVLGGMLFIGAGLEFL